MRVAIYARYSSDNQREASIADQLRICRLRAEQEGWQIVEEYTDHAISGASLLRPGIQAMMSDAGRGRFDLICAEAMDRLSRDQEDIAGFFKRMAFAGVKIVTLSEGEVTHLHIGLKGTMNALFLKDLADKTRRGQRGRVELGRSGGGNCYGYDVVRRIDAAGEPERGERSIDPVEAEVIRRIFRDYATGKSPKRIATELNAEGISAPTGGEWGFSTINGNARRGPGILNNELYIGRLVWNRQRFVKDPDTGKRQARPNPPEDWVTQEVPELRIVDEDLWQAVKARQAGLKRPHGAGAENSFRDRRRPKYLLSGLTRCGVCGGGYSMISATHVGCSTARNKGTCANRQSIRREELEERVLGALRRNLMDPAMFREFCEEFTREVNRQRIEGRTTLEAAQAEIRRIDRELDTLVDMILELGKGEATNRLHQKMLKLEARQKDLQAALSGAEEPPPLLHPEMAQHYRRQVGELCEALREETEAQRMEATELLRGLIKDLVLTPTDGDLAIDLRGDLAGILAVAAGAVSGYGVQKRRKPPLGAAFSADLVRQVEMVAGAGFEPAAFRL